MQKSISRLASSLLLAALLSSSTFAMQNLGTFGSMYKIKEKNIKVEIRKALDEKQEEITKLVKKTIEDGLIYKTDLPFSDKNKTITTEFYPGVKNKPHHKKEDICVVSFDGFLILDEIIRRFGKQCKYVFLNVDIRKISNEKKYENIEKFIGSEIFFSMFNPVATPVKITLDNGLVFYKYLDYKEIKAKVKNDLLIQK